MAGVDAIRAAAALLTRLPVRGPLVDVSGAAVFPLVGAAVGATGAAVLLLLGALGEPVVGAVAAVGIMALVSGGLHLDGLADTADALMAPDAERAEAARADPATGSGGVVALIVVLGAQVAALVSLQGGAEGPGVAAAACVSAAAVARATPVMGAWLWRRRARGDGFGSWFAARVGAGAAGLALALAAVVVVIAVTLVGSIALGTALAAGGAIGTLVLGWIVWRRDRLDGDGLGASVELTVAIALAAAAVAI